MDKIERCEISAKNQLPVGPWRLPLIFLFTFCIHIGRFPASFSRETCCVEESVPSAWRLEFKEKARPLFARDAGVLHHITYLGKQENLIKECIVVRMILDVDLYWIPYWQTHTDKHTQTYALGWLILIHGRKELCYINHGVLCTIKTCGGTSRASKVC